MVIQTSVVADSKQNGWPDYRCRRSFVALPRGRATNDLRPSDNQATKWRTNIEI